MRCRQQYLWFVLELSANQPLPPLRSLELAAPVERRGRPKVETGEAPRRFVAGDDLALLLRCCIFWYVLGSGVARSAESSWIFDRSTRLVTLSCFRRKQSKVLHERAMAATLKRNRSTRCVWPSFRERTSKNEGLSSTAGACKKTTTANIQY